MNGTAKRILVAITALVLAPLAALQAAEAVKIAVGPELAGVMREIIGATAERSVVSSEVIVWRSGYQTLQPPPRECQVIITGSDSEMDALDRHGQVVAPGQFGRIETLHARGPEAGDGGHWRRSLSADRRSRL